MLGKTVSGYTLQEELGSGPSGETFAATDREGNEQQDDLDQPVHGRAVASS